MSYISRKKRSKNFIVPTIFLSGLGAASVLAASPVSADELPNVATSSAAAASSAAVSSSATSKAASTASLVASDRSSAANSKAAANTSAAPAASSASAAGGVDVYVDHTKMDDAINNARAKGLSVNHEASQTLSGDASSTAANTSSAAAYYASNAAAIDSAVASYEKAAANQAKVTPPTINYHYYDIRSQPTSSDSYDNADGKTIVINSNSNAGGGKVAQGVVNQTVGVNTSNQSLPAHRTDKIEDLAIVTHLPKDVTYDSARTNSDPANWTTVYDAAAGTVTQTATPAYLVQANLNQDPNNDGTNSSTTNGAWQYQAPLVYFKLNNSDETYQVSSTTIVNKAYMYVGAGIQIRTDSSNPSKTNENSQYQAIDGQAVLPGSINNYVLTWDFDQYKNVNIDSAMQAKGLRLVDDFPETAVSLTGPISIIDPANGQVLFSSAIPKGTTLGSTGQFQDAKGKNVPGLTWMVVDKTNAPADLAAKLDGQALMISYTGTDGDFYQTYVQGGHNLDAVLPMTTAKIANQVPDSAANSGKTIATSQTVPDGTYNGNSYANVAYQSDFGNDYVSNTVTNTVPKLDPQKDAVLSFAKLDSLDVNKNKTAEIEDGSYFNYRAKGSKLPTNLSEAIHSYVITDKMDISADEYSGAFKVLTDSPITFKSGTELASRYPNGLASGSDISKYFTQTLTRDTANSGFSLVSLAADSDFLSQMDLTKTNLDFDTFFDVKRTGVKNDVTNTFNEIINGTSYDSNTVVTNSSESALDKLQDKLNSLTSSAASGISSNASGISSNASGIASMASAVSAVVKHVNEVQSATSSAVASYADSYFNHASEQISLVSSAADSAANSIASSASSAIASNADGMNKVASSAASAAANANSAVSELITSLASRLAAATEQSIGTMTIYDSSVKTDADALSYAVNRGIAAGAIKSIKKNAAGHFVVSYNESKTGINNTTKPVAILSKTPYRRKTIHFYTLKSRTQVRRALKKLGYSTKRTVKIRKVKRGYLAVVLAKSRRIR